MLRKIIEKQLIENDMNPWNAYMDFRTEFGRALEMSAADPEVVGFKSIACYRTGLDIAITNTEDQQVHPQGMEHCITIIYLKYEATRSLRLEDKALNDWIVNKTMYVSGQCGKPGWW